MEISCYKCGQVLEEGRPFCPHCAAPQIRVLVAEPVAVAAAGEMVAAAQIGLPATQTVPVLALPVQWSQAWKPCALATGIGTVLIFLRLYPAVAMFSVGFLSVIFYKQGHSAAGIKTVQGARLGAFGGLLCFGVMAVLGAIAVTVPEARATFQQQIVENAQKFASTHPGDPQVQAALEQMKTPEGLVMMLILGGILLLVVSVILGTLGGMLGGAIVSRSDRT